MSTSHEDAQPSWEVIADAVEAIEDIYSAATKDGDDSYDFNLSLCDAVSDAIGTVDGYTLSSSTEDSLQLTRREDSSPEMFKWTSLEYVYLWEPNQPINIRNQDENDGFIEKCIVTMPKSADELLFDKALAGDTEGFMQWLSSNTPPGYAKERENMTEEYVYPERRDEETMVKLAGRILNVLSRMSPDDLTV
jgi:hypothetical protein